MGVLLSKGNVAMPRPKMQSTGQTMANTSQDDDEHTNSGNSVNSSNSKDCEKSAVANEQTPEVMLPQHVQEEYKDPEVVAGKQQCQLKKQHHGNSKMPNLGKNHGSGPALSDRVPGQVLSMWNAIDEGLDKWLTINKSRPSSQKVGWKVVRLFVSSTFTDFYSEREVLVKHVMPQLNEWCQGRKIKLIECDLRWGIPKDSTTNDTVDICLNEIEKCLEETEGEAFFLNFLGERYGWIPNLRQIRKEVVEKYDLIDGISITHTEILHASLRSNTKNALFLFRDASILQQLPQHVMPLFVESSEFGKQSLLELKNQLRDRFPKQAYNYKCNFDSIDASPESTKVILNDLKDFEVTVVDFFKAAIDRKYPQLDEDWTSDEWNFVFQDAFIEKKGALLVGREAESKQLMDFISTENDHSDGMQRNYMLVTGPSGIGKSSLLANFVRNMKAANIDCIYNFASASPGSTVSTTVQEIFTRRLMLSTGLGQDDFDSLPYEKKMEHYQEILKLISKEQRKMVIVFDAVNQFSNVNCSLFNWLPRDLQGNVKCVIGCTDDWGLLQPITKQLEQYGCKELPITGFGPTETKEYIQSTFSRYNKRLDEEQMNDLASRNEACNPLWLSLACEELRIFGDFERLTPKIKSMPDSLQGLVLLVLQRLISEDDIGLVKDTICYLVCSTSGLTETELCWSNGTETEPLPLITWKRWRLLLQPYLLIVGKRRGEENLAFCHDSFNVVVKKNLLSDPQEKISYHQKLANVFKKHCDDNVRVAEEVPVQLEAAGEFAALIEFYRKDRRSLWCNQIMKSYTLKKIRCQTMVHGAKDKFASPVFICQMCSNRAGAFTPSPGLNKENCLICGRVVPFKKDSALAYVCMKHKDFTAPGTAKCRICRSVIFLQQKSRFGFNQMYLCAQCCSYGQRCTKLHY